MGIPLRSYIVAELIGKEQRALAVAWAQTAPGALGLVLGDRIVHPKRISYPRGVFEECVVCADVEEIERRYRVVIAPDVPVPPYAEGAP